MINVNVNTKTNTFFHTYNMPQQDKKDWLVQKWDHTYRKVLKITRILMCVLTSLKFWESLGMFFYYVTRKLIFGPPSPSPYCNAKLYKFLLLCNILSQIPNPLPLERYVMRNLDSKWRKLEMKISQEPEFSGVQDIHQNSCDSKYFSVVMVPFLYRAVSLFCWGV